MKDEASGNPISEFVGLRPKMYSFEMVCKKPDGTLETVGKHRAKGIQRSGVARFDHRQYLEQLRNPTENYAINRRLGSRLHQIYGMEVIFTSIIKSFTHPSPTHSNHLIPPHNIYWFITSHLTAHILACHHPFLVMSAQIRTCHCPFLNMQG